MLGRHGGAVGLECARTASTCCALSLNALARSHYPLIHGELAALARIRADIRGARGYDVVIDVRKREVVGLDLLALPVAHALHKQVVCAEL